MLNVVVVMVGLWVLYLLGKYVVKPYLHMLRYNRY